MAIRYIGTYNDFALEVNIELGGRYVNGVLTPPASWSGSVTQWSRHVQEETARRAENMTFISLEQSEIDALHYGGYPPGSAEANAYIAQVEANGWEWAGDKWVRSDSGQVFIPPDEPTPTGPTSEELLYANWQRTGGLGSMSYWRSIGSPLYYTPPPEPEP